MDPQLCRTLNHLSLEQLAVYLNVELKKIEGYYTELLEDKEFLEKLFFKDSFKTQEILGRSLPWQFLKK